MDIGVPRETRPGERRVAATPETVRKYIDKGHRVRVEAGAGAGAFHADADFAAAGAEIVPGDAAWGAALVLKVACPTREEAARLADGAHLLGLLYLGDDPELADLLRARHVTALAMEAVPRIARAQKMDALSSMANIAGYRAVLEAANVYPRYFPLLMTAAGTVPPANVLVIGAGVAGLSAIATAKRLGAVVRAFDTRPAVRDQVKSLGGEFLALDVAHHDAEDAGGYAKEASEEVLRKERELLVAACKQADIVVTTALVAGKRAPLLIDAATVAGMRPGSVIVDLAAERGGNCALTEAGQAVVSGGVTILGYTDLTSRMPVDSSRLYARNVLNLVLQLHGKAGYGIDLADEIARAVAVIRQEG